MTPLELNQLLNDLFVQRKKFEKTLSQKQKLAFNQYWETLQNVPLYSMVVLAEGLQSQIESLEKRLAKLKNSE